MCNANQSSSLGLLEISIILWSNLKQTPKKEKHPDCFEQQHIFKNSVDKAASWLDMFSNVTTGKDTK